MPISFPRLFDNLSHVSGAAFSDWGAMHPLLIHFPIVLLIIAPVFLLVGLFLKGHRLAIYACALALILLGTASLYIAASSGETAAEGLTQMNADALATFEKHYELAELTEKIFLALSLIACVLFILYYRAHQNLSQGLQMSAALTFLGLYTLGLIFMLNAAHYGGELVHHHSIHTNLYQGHQH